MLRRVCRQKKRKERKKKNKTGARCGKFTQTDEGEDSQPQHNRATGARGRDHPGAQGGTTRGANGRVDRGAGHRSTPTMSYPRNDGRRRKLWTGKVNDSDEATRSYLNAEQGKLRVFRCPECGVRVAQEADVCLRPSLERGQLAATFTRTFNLVRVDGSVCCCRCGVHLFPFDEKDPAMLTLPLYWEGNRVFQKTALRCTVVLDFNNTHIFMDEYSKAKPAHEQVLAKHKHLAETLPSFLKDWDVNIIHLARYAFSGYLNDNWRDFTDVDFFQALYRNAGAAFQLIPYPKTVDTLRALPTQDFALYLHCQRDSKNYLSWTDYNARYLEPCLMTLWLLTGGNVLFGDWGRPKQSAEREISEKDLEQLASDCEEEEPGSTNNEPAFAELIRSGHYLGYWSAKDEALPDIVMKKIVKAIDYRQVYPRWLFLRDFPPSQFDNLDRRGGDHHGTRPAFSASAKDLVEPKFPRAGENEMMSTPNCIIL